MAHKRKQSQTCLPPAGAAQTVFVDDSVPQPSSPITDDCPASTADQTGLSHTNSIGLSLPIQSYDDQEEEEERNTDASQLRSVSPNNIKNMKRLKLGDNPAEVSSLGGFPEDICTVPSGLDSPEPPEKRSAEDDCSLPCCAGFEQSRVASDTDSREERESAVNRAFKTHLHPHMFDLSKMKRMLARNHREKTEGRPCTISYKYGVFSCTIWMNSPVASVREVFRLAEENPDVYLPMETQHVDSEMSWCSYNLHCKHYPLALAVQDLSDRSTSYASLARCENLDHGSQQQDNVQQQPFTSDCADTGGSGGGYCNHNFLKTFRLLHGLTNLWIRLHDLHYPLKIFDDRFSSIEALAKTVMQNIWIKNGNLDNADDCGLFGQPVRLMLSPLWHKTCWSEANSECLGDCMEQATRRPLPESQREVCAMRIFKRIGRAILGLVADHTSAVHHVVPSTPEKHKNVGQLQVTLPKALYPDDSSATGENPTVQMFLSLEAVVSFFLTKAVSNPNSAAAGEPKPCLVSKAPVQGSCSSLVFSSCKTDLESKDTRHHRQPHTSNMTQARDTLLKQLTMVLRWFDQHRFWPAMLWNDSWAENSINMCRCLVLPHSSEASVVDFEQKLLLTGAGYWPMSTTVVEDPLFFRKPLVVACNVLAGRVQCLVVFDTLLTVPIRNFALMTGYLQDVNDQMMQKKLATVRQLPDAVKSLCCWMSKASDNWSTVSCKFFSERLLPDMVFLENSKDNSLKLKLCLYSGSPQHRTIYSKTVDSMLSPSCLQGHQPDDLGKPSALSRLCNVLNDILYVAQQARPCTAVSELTAVQLKSRIMSWKVGVLLVAMYKLFLGPVKSLSQQDGKSKQQEQHAKSSSSRGPDELQWKLNKYISDFELGVGCSDRLWVFPYRGASYHFSLLLAYIFHRQLDQVPLVNELAQSVWFTRWLVSRDMINVFASYQAELAYRKFHQQERLVADSLASASPTLPRLTRDVISLDAGWRDVSQPSNARNVIKAFTRSLKCTEDFPVGPHRNRLKLPIVFKITPSSLPHSTNPAISSNSVPRSSQIGPSNALGGEQTGHSSSLISEQQEPDWTMLEPGQGRGVCQEALTLYWKAVSYIGMFQPWGLLKERPDRLSKFGSLSQANSNKRHCFPTNVTPSHWFVLGLLLNHCTINDFMLHFDQPFVFFKLMSQASGSATPLTTVTLNPEDIADLGRDKALHLLKLFFLDASALSDLSLFLEDVAGDRGMSGQVTPELLPVYVAQVCRKTVADAYRYSCPASLTEFPNCDPCAQFEDLARGYSLTVPEFRPSARQLWRIFSQRPVNQINSTQIVSLLRFEEEQSSRELMHAHDDNCFTLPHMLCNGLYCPLTCLALSLAKMDVRHLELFLQFVTGSPLLPSDEASQSADASTSRSTTDLGSTISVIILKTPERTAQQCNRLPVSSTCVKTLTLFTRGIDDHTNCDSTTLVEEQAGHPIATTSANSDSDWSDSDESDGDMQQHVTFNGPAELVVNLIHNYSGTTSDSSPQPSHDGLLQLPQTTSSEQQQRQVTSPVQPHDVEHTSDSASARRDAALDTFYKNLLFAIENTTEFGAV